MMDDRVGPAMRPFVSRRAFLASSSAFALAGCVGLRPGEADGEPAVRFGYVTDCHFAPHIAPKPGEPRAYMQGLVKMEAFVREMNAADVDFVIEGGDFKDLGPTKEATLGALDAIEAAFARFNGPRYHVLGNHDCDCLTKEEFLAHVANDGQPSARAFYSFERGGITFIVLDACFTVDGRPYARGDFNWKECAIPAEQVAFLKATLDAAPGPCVPIVHHQLDAEDETCIRNAAEIRTVLEASGKVKLVVQGHWHEGSFREINGIGYWTTKANVLGDAPGSAAATVFEIFPSGGVRIYGKAGASSAAAAPRRGAWTGATAWRDGHYQVHYIFTGRGESMLHIFPDGTSMLLDCGDSMRFYGTPKETPHLPDLTRRAGEWVARYVERVNPKGRDVDYFHLSHYHEDHGGGERWHAERMKRPTGDYYRAGLADAARFLRFGRVVDRAWPDFADPLPVLATSRDGTPRQVRAVYLDLAAKGTAIEAFRLGARDQFRQLDAERAHRGFEIFNLCANGRFVRRDGTVKDLYADRVAAGAKVFNENGMSCGLLVTYGAFTYFTAGDFSDGYRRADKSAGQIEDLLAEAVGPVDVAKLNHHGHHSMFPELVRALRARVWTACVLDQAHCTDDTMSRLADRSLYAGERTFLPTYMPLNRTPTEFGRAFLADVPKAVVREPCHVVLDVPEGGETYTLSCLRAATEEEQLVARFGFVSRRA